MSSSSINPSVPLPQGEGDIQESSPSKNIEEGVVPLGESSKKISVAAGDALGNPDVGSSEITDNVPRNEIRSPDSPDLTTRSFPEVPKNTLPSEKIKAKFKKHYRFEDHIQNLSPQELKGQIGERRAEISQVKEAYRETLSKEPVAPGFEDVQDLIKTGSLQKIDGGNSGVYLLKDAEGQPRFIIKPYDECPSGLNNPKGLGSPHPSKFYGEFINESLASSIAEKIGVADCTPKCTVMILEHQGFADITDDLTSKKNKENYGFVDKEKLCSVQTFVPGCKDLQETLFTVDTFRDFKKRSENNENPLVPPLPGVNHLMFEKVTILNLVCGEQDGNLGNFLISEKTDSGEERSIYKIDNGGCFPQNNEIQDAQGNVSLALVLGVDYWLVENYESELSEKACNIIKDINISDISDLMRSQGKEELHVQAMESRVVAMKDFLTDGIPRIQGLGEKILVKNLVEYTSMFC